MFLAREESIVFGFFLLAYFFFIRHHPRRQVHLLVLNWFLWTSFTLLTFISSPHTFQYTATGLTDRLSQLFHSPPAISLLFVLLALVIVLIRFRLWRSRLFPLAAFFFLLPPVAFPLLSAFQDRPFTATMKALLFVDRWMLVVACLLIFTLTTWHITKNKNLRRVFAVSFLVLTILTSSLAFLSKHSPWHIMTRYATTSANNNWLFDLSGSLDPYNTVVLSDYALHPLFAHFEHSYVYQRLPVNMIPEDARNWPHNKPLLKKLLRDNIQFIFISNTNYPSLEPILQEADLTRHLDIIQSDNNYTAYQLNRS